MVFSQRGRRTLSTRLRRAQGVRRLSFRAAASQRAPLVCVLRRTTGAGSEPFAPGFPEMNARMSIVVSPAECAPTEKWGGGWALPALQFSCPSFRWWRYNAPLTDQEVRLWAENYL